MLKALYGRVSYKGGFVPENSVIMGDNFLNSELLFQKLDFLMKDTLGKIQNTQQWKKIEHYNTYMVLWLGTYIPIWVNMEKH